MELPLEKLSKTSSTKEHPFGALIGYSGHRYEVEQAVSMSTILTRITLDWQMQV